MTDGFPPEPNMREPLLATRPSPEARTFLALRRSTGKAFLTAPGPEGAELVDILRVAARVPDHRRLEPWRFIVFEGDARDAAGNMFARIHSERNSDAAKNEIETEKQRFLRAPVVIGVISSPDKDHKTPVWEQELSAGAVCQNLLLAANATGWAGVWLSEWICYDRVVAEKFDLTDDERFAGFIYLGTAEHQPQERLRPDVTQKTSYWTV